MALSKPQQIFAVIILIVALYMLYNYKFNKEGLETVAPVKSEITSDQVSEARTVVTSEGAPSVLSESEKLTKAETDKILMAKMMGGKNAGPGGAINFKEGKRGGVTDSLDKFFEEGNPLKMNQGEFKPADSSAAPMATYVGGPKREVSEEDKFKSSDLLPKENRPDWFEDVTPERIKNRHLINVYRNVGVNTVLASKKNSSLDIRGNEDVPKTVVSPFLNSSIDPDHNIKGLCK